MAGRFTLSQQGVDSLRDTHRRVHGGKTSSRPVATRRRTRDGGGGGGEAIVVKVGNIEAGPKSGDATKQTLNKDIPETPVWEDGETVTVWNLSHTAIDGVVMMIAVKASGVYVLSWPDMAGLTGHTNADALIVYTPAGKDGYEAAGAPCD